MNSPKPETKKVFLWLTLFLLILFTSELLLRLHPFGPHKFFWNLALSAIFFMVAARLLRRYIKIEFLEPLGDS